MPDYPDNREKATDALENAERQLRSKGEPHKTSDDAADAASAKPEETDTDETNPPRTTTGGWFTAPKFGSASSGGGEIEPGPERG